MASNKIEGLRPEAVRETVKQGHVKLVSDGKSGRSTHLLMPDGTPIPGIRHIRWSCEAGGRPELVVEFATAEVEIGSA